MTYCVTAYSSSDVHSILNVLEENTTLHDQKYIANDPVSFSASKSSAINKSASFLTRPFALFLHKELREWNSESQPKFYIAAKVTRRFSGFILPSSANYHHHSNDVECQF